jgi:hypothetical protein
MSPTKKGIHQQKKQILFFLPENLKISFIVEISKIGKTDKKKIFKNYPKSFKKIFFQNQIWN